MQYGQLSYELFYIVVILIFFLHCWKYHGKTYAIRIFIVGFLMGLIIENSGVIQGSYTEWGYLLYFPGSLVPIVTQIGWILVTYVCFSLAAKVFEAWPVLKRNLLIGAVITALIATFWDVLIDPIAVYRGGWVWTEQSWGPNEYGWLDVPIINWLAWFWCILGWALCTFYIDSKEDEWSSKKQIGAQTLAIFITGLILLVGIQISFFLIEGVWVPVYNPPEIPADYPWRFLFP